ncbi:unnamed protein product [Phyllotreta striolata]|uniref:Spaetzle domain-containing protein n=1 Tax=Phyllotreta striolata TaxID=444603 RepID=A0A9N9TI84_PHYSR|nr:unnamed protein product [Phyllotreta striolata]
MRAIVKVLFTLLLTIISVRQIATQIYDDVNGCIGNVCYKDEAYPYDQIQDTFETKSDDFTGALGKPHNTQKTSFAEGKSTAGCSLCNTKISKRMQIMSIMDDNNLKLYILSTSKYPRPSIHLETCLYKDAPCSLDNVPNDVMTRCIQKKTTINLLTFNATSKEFQAYALHYPSACECILLEEELD